MNVVDSSGWIEYLFERPNERFFAAAIHDTSKLLVPTVCLIEVIRYVTQAASRNAARKRRPRCSALLSLALTKTWHIWRRGLA